MQAGGIGIGPPARALVLDPADPQRRLQLGRTFDGVVSNATRHGLQVLPFIV